MDSGFSLTVVGRGNERKEDEVDGCFTLTVVRGRNDRPVDEVDGGFSLTAVGVGKEKKADEDGNVGKRNEAESGFSLAVVGAGKVKKVDEDGNEGKNKEVIDLADSGNEDGDDEKGDVEVEPAVGNEVTSDEVASVNWAVEQVETPRAGMSFPSLDELVEYYKKYATTQGFSVIRASRSKDRRGECRFQTVSCQGARKPSQKGRNMLRPRPTHRTDCKARLCCSLGQDGRWKINTVILDHNHPLCPGMAQFNFRIKRRMDDEMIGTPPNKSMCTLVNGAGYHEEISNSGNDCNSERAKFGEADMHAIYNMILRMRENSRDFFYAIDPDSEGRMKNVFWCDRRSRAAYAEFSDVVSFESEHLFCRYQMPLSLFSGINHHGHCILLGCAVIGDKEAKTYEWLFQTWLSCMSNHPPQAIITDQCNNVKSAVSIVFPQAQHSWCIWHIISQFPEKLKSYGRYDELKPIFMEIVNDSLTVDEFEEKWAIMVEKFELESNEWFLTLYENKTRWVPVYAKHLFWAGMQLSQRRESMSTYFDGYFNSIRSLRQFVDEYEIVIGEKIDKEISEDYKTMTVNTPCATTFGYEKQFQLVYTNNIFTLVQQEITGQMYCDADVLCSGGDFIEFDVSEKRNIRGGGNKRFSFRVHYNLQSGDVKCSCRSFEIRGILCRHVFKVLTRRDVENVPSCHILRRWRKDVSRRHSKTTIICAGDDSDVEMSGVKELEKTFYAAVEIAKHGVDKFQFYQKWLADGLTRLESWQMLSGSVNGDHRLSRGSSSARKEVVMQTNGQQPIENHAYLGRRQSFPQ